MKLSKFIGKCKNCMCIVYVNEIKDWGCRILKLYNNAHYIKVQSNAIMLILFSKVIQSFV